MDRFRKQPNEKFTITVDFSSRMDDDESVSSYTLAAINYDTEVDVESTIIDADTLSGDSVYITVKAGTTGEKYKLTVLATTSDGNIYEKDLIMEVREI